MSTGNFYSINKYVYLTLISLHSLVYRSVFLRAMHANKIQKCLGFLSTVYGNAAESCWRAKQRESGGWIRSAQNMINLSCSGNSSSATLPSRHDSVASSQSVVYNLIQDFCNELNSERLSAKVSQHSENITTLCFKKTWQRTFCNNFITFNWSWKFFHCCWRYDISQNFHH